MLTCPSCEAEISGRHRFCEACGFEIDHTPGFCAMCGAEVVTGSRFCSGCGAPLHVGDAAEPAATAISDNSLSDTTGSPVVPSEEFAQGATFAAPTPLMVWGLVLLFGSVFLPWISGPFAGTTGLDVPASFVFDLDASESGLSVGVLQLIAAGLVAVLAFVPAMHSVRRVLGLLVAITAIVVSVQWGRFLSSVDLGGELVNFLGVVVYAAFAGGVAAALAPSRRVG